MYSSNNNSHLAVMNKFFNYRLKLLFIFFVSLQIIGCEGEVASSHWEGQWERRVNVPSGQPGRCYDEVLEIDRRKWSVTATIHSTYECNQPFLELGFAGHIDEVLIRNGTDERDVTLVISDIHMTSMADITSSQRESLSNSSVQRLSDKYVPQKWQAFQQQLKFDGEYKTMSAPLFQPATAVAIPALLNKKSTVRFKR